MAYSWENYHKTTLTRNPSSLLVKAVSYATSKQSALDLGCGSGRDTKFLLDNFESVTAVDMEDVSEFLADLKSDKLHIVTLTFEDFDYANYDLINARFALPFIPPEHFDETIDKILKAVNPAGILVGQFFGVRDSWNKPNSGISFQTREQVEALLADFELLHFEEEDKDGETALGEQKHWHVFHVIAKKRG